MATNMAVKISAMALEANKVLKIPDAREADVRIRTGIKLPIKPACSKPFIEAIVSSSASLNSVMKERDRRRMDDTQRAEFS